MTRVPPGMSEDLCFLSAAELRERIASKGVSPVEVTRAVLARAEALQGELNCFITLCGEEAMADARAAERKVMILLPRAADELKIPFVASGGMADARSLVASLAMGAEGMNMGTRFIATKEAPVHDNVKQAILQASELDTRLIMRPIRNTERVLKNAGVDKIMEIEREKGAKTTIADVHDLVAGVYPRVMLEGDMDAGAWSCGMVAGLIYDIPTVKELIDRIMAEAEKLVRIRLERMVAA